MQTTFCIQVLVICTWLSVTCLVVSKRADRVTTEGPDYWNAMAKEDLENSLKLSWNQNIARNVILFIGDGMGPNTVTASRIYKYGESGKLSFENFPHVGILKTYDADKQVPDSASTATALFSGVKTNYKTGGVDQSVKHNDFEGSLRPEARLKNILHWAQEAGKDTGFVTTTRVTHATPSALYAHYPERNWECEANIPQSAASKCKDIARQLVEDLPGRNIKVIMGGGRQCLNTNLTLSDADPLDTWSCRRQDGRELTAEWQEEKSRRGVSYTLLNNTGDLLSLDISNTEYVMGIFANGHLKYDFERDTSHSGMPSLKQMTSTAIKILKKNPNGFLLVVEGGMIDQAHHRGYARRALDETVAMSEAVQEALNFIGDIKTSDTLLISTSDHTHSLSINGYPDRGNNILGIGDLSKDDGVPYTTLTYATGDFYAYNYTADENGTVHRADPTEQDTTSFHYHQQAAVRSNEAHHGGGDVVVYAAGPMAHLFHSVHEQHYVAHVIAYAMKIGNYSNSSHVSMSSCQFVLTLLIICITLFST